MIQSYAYVTCERCGGTGFAPFIGALFIRCRKCGGTGERQRTAFRIFNILRHGAASSEDY